MTTEGENLTCNKEFNVWLFFFYNFLEQVLHIFPQFMRIRIVSTPKAKVKVE